MTAKTELNLLCLKWWKAPAVYESTRAGGPPHDPLWDSKCTLPNGNFFTVEGVRGSQKTAENIVASRALQQCRQPHIQTQMGVREAIVKVSGNESNNFLLKEASSKVEQQKPSSLTPILSVVFVDCDNIAFCNAAFCARFPTTQFRFYVSFQRNMPFVDNAVRMCANTTKCPALHNGSDVCDVMILFDVVRLVDECERTGNKKRIIIVSGDKLLYNAQLLLSPHVLFVGCCDALEQELLK